MALLKYFFWTKLHVPVYDVIYWYIVYFIFHVKYAILRTSLCTFDVYFGPMCKCQAICYTNSWVCSKVQSHLLCCTCNLWNCFTIRLWPIFLLTDLAPYPITVKVKSNFAGKSFLSLFSSREILSGATVPQTTSFIQNILGEMVGTCTINGVISSVDVLFSYQLSAD